MRLFHCNVLLNKMNENLPVHQQCLAAATQVVARSTKSTPPILSTKQNKRDIARDTSSVRTDEISQFKQAVFMQIVDRGQ